MSILIKNSLSECVRSMRAMRLKHLIAEVFIAGLLLVASAPAQQGAVSSAPQPQVYDFGSTTTAPQLLHFNSPLNTPANCYQDFDGKLKLFIEIDASGVPSQFYFLEPHGDDLDRFTIQILEQERFSPATVGGAPVAVRASLEMVLKSCVEQTQNPDGSKGKRLRLREPPRQELRPPPKDPQPKMAGNPNLFDPKTQTTRPMPINTVRADMKGIHVQGVCMVSITVDEHGMPTNPQVVKGLETRADENALQSVMRYRFRPAMKDGIPVALKIMIQVNFQLG